MSGLSSEEMRRERIRRLVAGQIREAVNVPDVAIESALSGTPMVFKFEVDTTDAATEKTAAANGVITDKLRTSALVSEAANGAFKAMGARPSSIIFDAERGGKIHVCFTLPVSECRQIRERLALTGAEQAR